MLEDELKLKKNRKKNRVIMVYPGPEYMLKSRIDDFFEERE